MGELCACADESGMTWRKSGYSNPSGNCVELAWQRGGQVFIRDSHQPQGPRLGYSQAQFAAFVRGAKQGSFDRLSH